MISPQEALERLIAGNRRFVEEMNGQSGHASAEQRHALLEGQSPFAVILGCSDSRVPPEVIFDQGLGDLFVIRVAGNIVTPTQIGSVEFAAEQLGARLVLVLGHSWCGAVQATLQSLQQPAGSESSDHLRAIIDRIRPAVKDLLEREGAEDAGSLLEAAVRANVQAGVEQLRQESEVLGRMIDRQEVKLVGAEYSLESGVVNFLS